MLTKFETKSARVKGKITRKRMLPLEYFGTRMLAQIAHFLNARFKCLEFYHVDLKPFFVHFTWLFFLLKFCFIRHSFIYCDHDQSYFTAVNSQCRSTQM